MELLITGSTGFVGRNLLLSLLTEERWKEWGKIILPVRDPEKLRVQITGEGIEFNERIQICQVSGDTWVLPLSIRPDLVIHAAGRLFGRERGEYWKTNVMGSLNLAAQLPESTRMILLSSLAAGGPTPEGSEARTIEDEDAPVSFYGDSKLSMEQELRKMMGERLLSLRPPMVLGPRDSATLPLFKMAKGSLRVKPGYAPKHYSWIAVDDLCGAILTASLSQWPRDQNRSFYLGSSGIISDSQLLETAASVIGCRGFTLPLPQTLIQIAALVLDRVPSWREAVPSLGIDRVKEILPRRWVAEGKEFSQHFGWKPNGDFRETLRITAAWLQGQGKI